VWTPRFTIDSHPRRWMLLPPLPPWPDPPPCCDSQRKYLAQGPVRSAGGRGHWKNGRPGLAADREMRRLARAPHPRQQITGRAAAAAAPAAAPAPAAAACATLGSRRPPTRPTAPAAAASLLEPAWPPGRSSAACSCCPCVMGSQIRRNHSTLWPPPLDDLPRTRAFPASILCDKNRRDIGKSQPKWTASKMETPGSPSSPHDAALDPHDGAGVAIVLQEERRSERRRCGGRRRRRRRRPAAATTTGADQPVVGQPAGVLRKQQQAAAAAPLWPRPLRLNIDQTRHYIAKSQSQRPPNRTQQRAAALAPARSRSLLGPGSCVGGSSAVKYRQIQSTSCCWWPTTPPAADDDDAVCAGGGGGGGGGGPGGCCPCVKSTMQARTPKERSRAAASVVPARAFPSSICRDKNRRDVGKSQPTWTASKMETPGGADACAAAPQPAAELGTCHAVGGDRQHVTDRQADSRRPTTAHASRWQPATAHSPSSGTRSAHHRGPEIRVRVEIMGWIIIRTD
jgi:hypothetical protein